MIEANDVTGNSGTIHCSTVLNYGGGRQTVAMCVLIARGVIPRPNVIVMADTGRENPSTWEYLEQHVTPYLAQHGACWMCPHKRNAEWRHIRDNYPDQWQQALAMDEEVREHDDRNAVFLHHDRVPLREANIDVDESEGKIQQCTLGVCFV